MLQCEELARCSKSLFWGGVQIMHNFVGSTGSPLRPGLKIKPPPSSRDSVLKYLDWSHCCIAVGLSVQKHREKYKTSYSSCQTSSSAARRTSSSSAACRATTVVHPFEQSCVWLGRVFSREVGRARDSGMEGARIEAIKHQRPLTASIYR